MIGKYLLDYKDFTHYIDGHISRIDTDLSVRLTKAEYVSTDKAKRRKLKNRVNTALGGFEERLSKLESSFTEDMAAFKRKQEEIELNTYWKIDDYKKLLMTRISETFMKDYVSEEATRLTNSFKDLLDKRADEINRSIKVIEQDDKANMHSMQDQLEEMKRMVSSQGQM
jgi:hypothetical protein